jgi:hypothetical protein
MSLGRKGGVRRSCRRDGGGKVGGKGGLIVPFFLLSIQRGVYRAGGWKGTALLRYPGRIIHYLPAFPIIVAVVRFVAFT